MGTKRVRRFSKPMRSVSSGVPYENRTTIDRLHTITDLSIELHSLIMHLKYDLINKRQNKPNDTSRQFPKGTDTKSVRKAKRGSS